MFVRAVFVSKLVLNINSKMDHISIVRSTGKKFDFEISLEESVGALKEKLSSFFKIPANTIRLIYAGKEMKINKAKLSAFNVGRHENFNICLLYTSPSPRD